MHTKLLFMPKFYIGAVFGDAEGIGGLKRVCLPEIHPKQVLEKFNAAQTFLKSLQLEGVLTELQRCHCGQRRLAIL